MKSIGEQIAVDVIFVLVMFIFFFFALTLPVSGGDKQGAVSLAEVYAFIAWLVFNTRGVWKRRNRKNGGNK